MDDKTKARIKKALGLVNKGRKAYGHANRARRLWVWGAGLVAAVALLAASCGGDDDDDDDDDDQGMGYSVVQLVG